MRDLFRTHKGSCKEWRGLKQGTIGRGADGTAANAQKVPARRRMWRLHFRPHRQLVTAVRHTKPVSSLPVRTARLAHGLLPAPLPPGKGTRLSLLLACWPGWAGATKPRGCAGSAGFVCAGPGAQVPGVAWSRTGEGGCALWIEMFGGHPPARFTDPRVLPVLLQLRGSSSEDGGQRFRKAAVVTPPCLVLSLARRREISRPVRIS